MNNDKIIIKQLYDYIHPLILEDKYTIYQIKEKIIEYYNKISKEQAIEISYIYKSLIFSSIPKYNKNNKNNFYTYSKNSGYYNTYNIRPLL